MDPAQITDLLASSVRLSIPIAFAALGGVFAERSGVYNIGLEGMILGGAFGAAAGSYLTGSAEIGLLCGLIVGMLGASILAAMTVYGRVNQLVAGIAVNLLLAGLTAFLARAVFGEDAGQATVTGYQTIAIPLFSKIPLIGQAFFNQDPLTYLLYILAPATLWFLYRTGAGLTLRATGESPRAADSAGVSVFRVRSLSLIVSGALAGLGGCHLVLSQIYLFTEGMSAGKGFIALAAIILGRWNPVFACVAALFFGFCDAAQLRLQFANPDVPYQVFLILPYLASIIALVGLIGVVRTPQAIGLPYDRESR